MQFQPCISLFDSCLLMVLIHTAQLWKHFVSMWLKSHDYMCLSHFYSWSCSLVMWGQQIDVRKRDVLDKISCPRFLVDIAIKQTLTGYSSHLLGIGWCVPPSMCLNHSPSIVVSFLYLACVCSTGILASMPDQTIYDEKIQQFWLVQLTCPTHPHESHPPSLHAC